MQVWQDLTGAYFYQAHDAAPQRLPLSFEDKTGEQRRRKAKMLAHFELHDETMTCGLEPQWTFVESTKLPSAEE